MKAFAALYARLDQSTATGDKVAAMVEYFGSAPPEDAAWAVHWLTGGRVKRLVRSTDLRQWLIEASALPEWLIDDTYAHVGDLAETITLLTQHDPAARAQDTSLAGFVATELLPLAKLTPEAQGAVVRRWWQSFSDRERFVVNKLLTGGLRVGVSRLLVVQALAKLSGQPSDLIAHRLSGDFQPTAQAFAQLIAPGDVAIDADKPYPFFLASPLEQAPESLGSATEWLAEWKWDGIRAQLIVRGGVRLWSRGEERLDGRFPEIERAAAALPDGCVLDGEILGWIGAAPLPFSRLQKRIGRLKPGAKTLADCPVVFMAYDLIEYQRADLRQRPLRERRQLLDSLVDASTLRLSEPVPNDGWPTLEAARNGARDRGVEGLILKRWDSAYATGRRRGDWWKWKIAPLTIDAVLIYAQAGHGRRSNLYTDYTFALWHGDELVPVAKAYSGLNDEEIAKLDRWIRAHTLDRFGPVRSVEAFHVFELAFEGVNRSTRHKSGIAVRFPRILRWRTDKPFQEADRLETLAKLAQ